MFEVAPPDPPTPTSWSPYHILQVEMTTSRKPEYQAKDFTEFLEFVFDAVRVYGRRGIQACSQPQHLMLGFETPRAVYLIGLTQLVGAATYTCGAEWRPFQLEALAFRPAIETILDFYGHKIQATMIAAESPAVDLV